MRHTFTSITGVVIAVAGLLWIYELATDNDVPWQWVLAVGLVLFVAIVFTSAFAAGIMASFAPGKGNLTAAGATPVRHAMHDGAASVVQ
ncbi:MAG: hypothetical protein KDC46_08435 [Thermoleophilia bacterium]|nr:hypothetical protein [Thermoleophilia bacterium]